MLKDRYNMIYDGNITADAIINAVQPELDTLVETLANLFHDTFVATATPQGIAKWENILSIVPSPSIETLGFRRERILNRLISDIPYTERALEIVMDNIMGAGNWSYELDYRNYELDINSLRHGKNWMNEVELTLKKMIPANIEYALNIRYNTHEALRVYTHAQLGQFTHQTIREEDLA